MIRHGENQLMSSDFTSFFRLLQLGAKLLIRTVWMVSCLRAAGASFTIIRPATPPRQTYHRPRPCPGSPRDPELRRRPIESWTKTSPSKTRPATSKSRPKVTGIKNLWNRRQMFILISFTCLVREILPGEGTKRPRVPWWHRPATTRITSQPRRRRQPPAPARPRPEVPSI